MTALTEALRSSGIDEAKLYDATLKAKQEAEERTPSRWPWHPSSMGYCLTRQWMEALGVPRTNRPDLQALRAYDSGNLHHDVVRQVFDLQGRRILPSGECLACGEPVVVHTDPVGGRHGNQEFHLVDEELGVSGYLDILVGAEFEPGVGLAEKVRAQLRRSASVPAAMEVKSVEPGALWYAKQDGPSEHNWLQLATDFLIYERNPDQLPIFPERWLLLLVARAKNPRTKQFPKWETFPLPERYIEQARERIDALNHALETKNAPPCSCSTGMGGHERKWCAYAYAQGGSCCDVGLVA